jgi:hypothetical protein
MTGPEREANAEAQMINARAYRLPLETLTLA